MPLAGLPVSKCDGVYRGLAYDFESVCNNADSHQFLAVVPSVHHQGVGEALYNGALGFSETLDGIAAGGVGDVDR